MTRTELDDKIGKVFGELYWWNHHKKFAAEHPEFKALPEAEKKERLFGLSYDGEALKAEYTRLREMKRRRQFEEEKNARGNTIIRWSRHGADRLHWDFGACSPKFGWKQYDTKQDASYFGLWVHIEKRLTFTYCEGDCSLVICPDVEHLRAELEDCEKFYGPPPPFAVAGDGLDSSGKLINPVAYYDERPKV